jgi:hypothetical protein
MATSKPACASASEQALPIPRLAPVTMAICGLMCTFQLIKQTVDLM